MTMSTEQKQLLLEKVKTGYENRTATNTYLEDAYPNHEHEILQLQYLNSYQPFTISSIRTSFFSMNKPDRWIFTVTYPFSKVLNPLPWFETVIVIEDIEISDELGFEILKYISDLYIEDHC